MAKLVFELKENKNKRECKAYPIICKVVYNAGKKGNGNSKIFKTRKVANDVIDVEIDMEGGSDCRNSFRFKMRGVEYVNENIVMVFLKLEKAIQLYNSKVPNNKIKDISVDIKIRKG